MVAVTGARTPVVLIGNVAVFDWAATVMDRGTVALELLDVSPIMVPPEGALPMSVIVPVDRVPPTTEVGDTVKLLKLAAVTVKLAVCWLAPIPAEILSVSVFATPLVVTVKVAVFVPPGTKTVEGT